MSKNDQLSWSLWSADCILEDAWAQGRLVWMYQSTRVISSPELCECELLCITCSECHGSFPGEGSFTNTNVASMFNSP